MKSKQPPLAKNSDPEIILFQNCEEVIPKTELLKKIKKKKPLIVKAGFDPTAKNLHLGHMVLFRKLRHFQNLGHKCYFLIGDFTGQIGDPSGRNATRPALSSEQVKNFSTDYAKQIGKILDLKKIHIVYNSKWHAKMNSSQLLQLCMHSTVAQMLAREDFSQRYRQSNSISLVEFMYPLLQAYDSVAMKAEVELGGTDQKFNLLLGREMQVAHGQEPQCIMTLPLLIGLDGKRKMSKSLHNTIELSEDTFSVFSKIMSVSDRLMSNYFFSLTDFKSVEIKALLRNPLEAKKTLATNIVAQLSSVEEGAAMKQQWEQQTAKENRKTLALPKNTPDETYMCGDRLFDVIFASPAMEGSSKSALRTLFKSRAIKMGLNMKVISDPDFVLDSDGGYALKIGKKKYLRLLCNHQHKKNKDLK